MKKKTMAIMTLMSVFFVALFSTTVFAGKQTELFVYAGLEMEAHIECSSTRASGYTNGAQMDGYKNYIKVVSYNKNGNMIDYGEKNTILKTEVVVTKGNPYSASSFHAATDYNGKQLLPIYNQFQLSEGR